MSNPMFQHHQHLSTSAAGMVHVINNINAKERAKLKVMAAGMRTHAHEQGADEQGLQARHERIFPKGSGNMHIPRFSYAATGK